MLIISGLTKTFGSQMLFDNASLTLGRGERIGFMGRNGSGKSTLFDMILGQSRADEGQINTPSGYRIGHLEQHIRFTEDTVLMEACTALPPVDDGRDESYKAQSVLQGLGFDTQSMDAAPSSLSGGFQVRLNLAKAILGEPDLLLLDEPTNYLDIISIRWLTGFLRNWDREFMLITHDRAFMDSVTTHTVGIRGTKLVKVEGGSDKYINRVLMEEETYENERMNDERKRKDAERFINRFRATATRAKAVQSRIKQLGKVMQRDKLPIEKDLSFSFNYMPFIGKWMMETHDLRFAYPDSDEIIPGLTMRIKPGDRIAIIGRNGAGKTTLLNLLAGELHPTTGNVSVNAKTGISYFGQTNVERLHPQKTVEQEIMDAAPDIGQKMARNIAGAMMFEGDAALKKTSVLSGGEKSRVLLGRILASQSNLLLLDEPTNHLDVESVDSLLGAIDNFAGAVVIVTHSEMILDALAERLIVFDEGKVFAFEGTYRDFLDKRGFAHEEIEGSKQTPKAPQSKSMDKKELKRLRAELINTRSRTLNPLKDKVTALEDEITTLEGELDTCERDLVKASADGDGGKITQLSMQMHAHKERIETLFDELASTSEKHDELEADYARQLEELSQ